MSDRGKEDMQQSTPQKGRVGEYRVAELIMMRKGKPALACYEPTVDDEGIDLIVKEKGKPGVIFLQVKSRFTPGENFTVTVKKDPVIQHIDSWALVVCHFGRNNGELSNVWYLDAGELVEVNKRSRRADKDKVLAFSKSKRNRKEFRIGPGLERDDDIPDIKPDDSLADILARRIQKNLDSLC